MANCYIQSQINNFRPGLEIRGLSSSQLLNNAWLVDMDVDATKPPVCAMLNAKMQKSICRMRNIWGAAGLSRREINHNKDCKKTRGKSSSSISAPPNWQLELLAYVYDVPYFHCCPLELGYPVRSARRKWSFGFWSVSHYAIGCFFWPEAIFAYLKWGGKLSTHTQGINKLYSMYVCRWLWAIIHWGIANLLALSDCC